MSVLIKGMKMPENCAECMNSYLRTTIRCAEWTEISAGRRENERAWSCPLVDLGKHGNLIDADELAETAEFYETVMDIRHHAKTVIEADGTDEGSN